jgi:hypothetical protein
MVVRGELPRFENSRNVEMTEVSVTGKPQILSEVNTKGQPIGLSNKNIDEARGLRREARV